MPPPRVNTDALQAQILALSERTENGVNEIKDMILAIDARLRAIEIAQAGELPLLRIRLDAAWKKIDGHEERIGKLAENAATALATASRLESVTKWLLYIFTAVLIAVVILFVTGKATIVFK